MSDKIKERPMAMIGRILAVCCDRGDKIFDLGGNLLGIVDDRKPVVNEPCGTVYLSKDDWEAAKRALPQRPSETLPGLPGGRSVH